jgi:hypothetical protein
MVALENNRKPNIEMPYELEHWGKKAIVVNSQTGRHFSLQPLSLQVAKAQMRLLESKAKDEPKPRRQKNRKIYTDE